MLMAEAAVLLITTVEIGNGHSDQIVVRAGQIPWNVAEDFCMRHSLPEAVLEPLTEHIKEHLSRAGIRLDPVTGAALAELVGQPHVVHGDESGNDNTEHMSVPEQDESQSEQYNGDSYGMDAPRHVSEDYIGSPTGAPMPTLDSSPLIPGNQPQRAHHGSARDDPEQRLRDLPAGEPCIKRSDSSTGSSVVNSQVRMSFGAKSAAAAMDEEEMAQRLSQKLMPVDSSTQYLVVSGNNLAKGAPGSQRGSILSDMSFASHRASLSAEPSPRVYDRLYHQAQDQRAKQDAKRRAADEELQSSLRESRKAMSWISAEMMKNRGHGMFANYGEMLYAEGLEQFAHRQAKAAQLKAQRKEHELDGATFMPEISRLAKALWSGENVESQPAWQRLGKGDKSRLMERMKQIKEMQDKEELKDCTFRPAINKESVAMMTERIQAQKALNIKAHDQLYADAIRRQQRQKAMQNWLPDDVTFKPVINRTSAAEAAFRRSNEALLAKASSNGLNSEGSRTAGAGNSPAGSPTKSSGPAGGALGPEASKASTASLSVVDRLYLYHDKPTVVDRLYLFHEKTNAKLEEKRRQLGSDIDPATGRKLYVPEVNRTKSQQGYQSMRTNSKTGPVGETLYAAGLDFLSQKEAKLEGIRQKEKDAVKTTFAESKSRQLYQDLRLRRFKMIFNHLDDMERGHIDLVGLVRSPTEQMELLDSEVREDVETAAAIHAALSNAPLRLPEDEETDVSKLPLPPLVDFDMFTALMEEALTKRRKPRSYLVPSPGPKHEERHSFQPAIDPKSRALASKVRPMDAPTHEFLYQSAEAMRQKLEAARKEADEKQLEGCTFVPALRPVNTTGELVKGRALRAAYAAVKEGASIKAAKSCPPPQQADDNMSVVSLASTSMTGKGSELGRQMPPGAVRFASAVLPGPGPFRVDSQAGSSRFAIGANNSSAAPQSYSSKYNVNSNNKAAGNAVSISNSPANVDSTAEEAAQRAEAERAAYQRAVEEQQFYELQLEMEQMLNGAVEAQHKLDNMRRTSSVVANNNVQQVPPQHQSGEQDGEERCDEPGNAQTAADDDDAAAEAMRVNRNTETQLLEMLAATRDDMNQDPTDDEDLINQLHKRLVLDSASGNIPGNAAVHVTALPAGVARGLGSKNQSGAGYRASNGSQPGHLIMASQIM